MNKQFSKEKVVIGLMLLILIALSMSVILSTGCTKRLDGEINQNMKPVVYFVNIPPPGHKFSRNPEIHWVGTDRDGLISYFRYHVVTAPDMGATAPMDYIAAVAANDWIRLDVEPKGPDPMTSNIVAMSADLTDPVLTYVDQYVFLQAYDEEGLGSDIIYRVYSRNDNPPNSFVFGFYDSEVPFVNSVEPGGIITGVRLHWQGSDVIDYPSEPPPFEFDWRLYGPYTEDDMDVIRDEFQDSVYVTNDGGVYRMGDTVIRCDTFFLEDTLTEACDTLVVAHDTPRSAFGGLEHIFFVEDDDFKESPYRNIQQVSDGWVTNTFDTLWNVFAGKESDTTVQLNFIFWLRSRDDAQVPDLVPFFREIPVIDPRYERDIAIVDFSKPLPPFVSDPISLDLRKSYWKTTVDAWGRNTGRDIVFDTNTITTTEFLGMEISPDYYSARFHGVAEGGLPIKLFLNHKVLVIYDDVLGAPQPVEWRPLFKSIDAGVNVWLTARTPLIGGSSQTLPPQNIIPSFEYMLFFGVTSMGYGAWMYYLEELDSPGSPPGRYQDFVGALWANRVPNSEPWPNLSIDTAKLHSRYKWYRGALWNEDCQGLPEVDWSVRLFGTEILYKYESCYGDAHPLGALRDFHGNPVAHRFETSFYRTAHFNFTTLAMEDSTMQIVIDSLFNWLYDPTLGSGLISENRYEDAQVKISSDEARQRYRDRTERYKKEDQELLIIE